MPAVKQISATARAGVGKGAARAVRRAGQVPAVIYGADLPPTPIALDANATNLLVYAGQFLTTVFEVDVDGSKTRVLPRDYQLDPVKDTVEHVDFLRLSAGARIRIDLPVHVTGQENSPGIKKGGTVNVVTHTLTVTVPGDAIPEAITVDVGALDINESLHVSQVSLPEGVRPVGVEDETLVSLVPPSDTAEPETPVTATPAPTK